MEIESRGTPEGSAVRTVDGNLAKRPVPGYCRFCGHPGALTIRMIKKKRCTEQHCRYFRRNDEHPVWVQVDRHKQEARERRKARREKIRAWEAAYIKNAGLSPENRKEEEA